METFKAIKERRSTRRFKDVDIEFEQVMAIIEAGTLAPSAGNLQNTAVVVVTQKNIKDQIAMHCSKQYWISTAPIVLVVIGDPGRAKAYYGERGDLYTRQNSAAVIENMLLAATALNVDSCWVGAFNEDLIKDTIGVPSSHTIEAIVCLGFSDEITPRPTKVPIEHFVFFERYGGAGRIYDIAALMGYFSDINYRLISTTKSKINLGFRNFISMVREKMKHLFDPASRYVKTIEAKKKHDDLLKNIKKFPSEISGENREKTE